MNMSSIVCASVAVLALGAGSAHASTVSVSPGGNTTFAGSATLQVTGPSGIEYSGTCNLSMQGYFNPSTAALSISSADFDYPCGTYTGGWPVSSTANPPWHGSTVAISSVSWKTPITDASIDLIQEDGFNPRWAADCSSSVAWPMYWGTNASGTASSVTTSGLKKFATTASGRSCYISFTLYLSPFQTFTTHP
ncbi:MAG TPA: hypothetical protein VFS55_01045 [Dokdonella sp.]|nr:hypothetical protein [Dokdonella sp.]